MVLKWLQQGCQYDGSDDKHCGNSTLGQLPYGTSTLQQRRRTSTTQVCRDADRRIQQLAAKHARWPGGHEGACGTLPGAAVRNPLGPVRWLFVGMMPKLPAVGSAFEPCSLGMP